MSFGAQEDLSGESADPNGIIGRQTSRLETSITTTLCTHAFYIQSPRLQSNLPSTDGISFCRSS